MTASGCAQLAGSNEQVKAIVNAAREAEDNGKFEEAQSKLVKLKQLPKHLGGSTEEKRAILTEIIKLYTALARHYQENGDFVTAKRLLQRAVEIECIDEQWLHEGGLATQNYKLLMKSQSTDKQMKVEKRVGDIGKTSNAVERLIVEAQKLEREGKFEQSLASLKQTEKLCPPDSSQKAAVLAAMAPSLDGLSRNKDAILALKEALRIYKDKPPAYPNVMIVLLAQLAYDLELCGREQEASEIFAQALAMTEKHPGEFADEVYLLGRCSRNLISLKKFDEGERLEARFFKTAKPGKNIDFHQTLMHNIEVGDVYYGNKMSSKATQSYKRAIKLTQGTSHPQAQQVKESVGYAYVQLANSELSSGDIGEATAHAIAAADLVNKRWKLGVAGTLNNLAGCYLNKGEAAKGLPLNERALKLCEDSVGRFGLPTFSTLIQYSDVAYASGDSEKSRQCLVDGMNRSKHIADCDEKRNLQAETKKRMKARGFKF